MTPNQLGEYLDVLRAKRVVSAGLEIPWKVDGALVPVKISVMFGPEPLDVDVKADAPTPGGWKGTSGLDESLREEDIP